MKQRPELQPKADRWSYLWLVLALFFSLFTFGPWQVAPAAWFATIFIVRFLRTQRVLPGILLVMFTTAAVTIYVGRDVVPFPFPITAGFLAIQSMIGALPFLADRLLAPRVRGFASTLILPLAVTAWEFVNLTTSPLGSFGSQAYSQYGNLALMQLVSVTGIWGITFLINWFAAIVNWMWEADFERRTVQRGLGTIGIVFVLVWGYGYTRLLTATPATVSTRMVGISAAKEDAGTMMRLYHTDQAAFRERAAERHAHYMEATRHEANANAKLVLWPEGALIAEDEAIQSWLAEGQALAADEEIYLGLHAMSLFTDETRPAENKFYLIDSTGVVVLEHTKYGGNFLEGTLEGDKVLQTVETPMGLLTGVICWDADFVNVMRQIGTQGVDLLLIGANDWAGVSEIHAQMAVFRAIENGTVLFRQAYDGVSIATDAYGHVLAQVDHFTTSEHTLVAQVPTDSAVFTLYSIIGDAVGWAAVIGFLILGLVAMSGRLRPEV